MGHTQLTLQRVLLIGFPLGKWLYQFILPAAAVRAPGASQPHPQGFPSFSFETPWWVCPGVLLW